MSAKRGCSRGIVERTDEIASDRLAGIHGQQNDVRTALQIAPEPAFAESIPLGSRGEGAPAGLEENGVDLRAEPA